MNKFTLLLFVFCIGNLAFSQTGWQPEIVNSLDNHDWAKPERTTFKYTGHPYVEEDFIYGSVNDEDGNSRYAFLRYNAIEEIVEVKFPDPDHPGIKVLPKVKDLSYSLNDYKYIFDSFSTNEGEEIEGYLIEYYNGETIGLYGNPLPKLTEAQYAKITLGQGRLPHLGVEVEYYLKNKDGILHNVKLRDKDFKNVLPESKELNEYMKENKLKTPQDYALMLKWLDNL